MVFEADVVVLAGFVDCRVCAGMRGWQPAETKAIAKATQATLAHGENRLRRMTEPARIEYSPSLALRVSDDG